MKTQNRILAIGFALLCLGAAFQSAVGQEVASRDGTHHFEFDKVPVSKVLDWLVEISGIPLNCTRTPSGSITFKPEVGPGGRPKRYTVLEIIDELNEILSIRPGSKWMIVRHRTSLGLYGADEPIPIDYKLIGLRDLNTRDFSTSEFVVLRFQLTTGRAARTARAIKEFMGPFGQVVPEFEANQLILFDRVGSLRTLIPRIEEYEMARGG